MLLRIINKYVEKEGPHVDTIKQSDEMQITESVRNRRKLQSAR